MIGDFNTGRSDLDMREAGAASFAVIFLKPSRERLALSTCGENGMAIGENGRGALPGMAFGSIMFSGTRHSSPVFRRFGAPLTMRHENLD
jgi:hypothetical protein